MTWVRRQAGELQAHRCEPPMDRVPPDPMAFDVGDPAGGIDDLWRCDSCAALWRVASACDGCDQQIGHNRCRTGLKWRRARLGQRFKAWMGRQ